MYYMSVGFLYPIHFYTFIVPSFLLSPPVQFIHTLYFAIS